MQRRYGRVVRGLAYGAAGWAMEAGFRSVVATIRARRLVPRPPTTPLMAPIYALALPLFEPAHDRLRGRSVPARASTYAAGILATEAAAGWLLRRVTGRCPWDYSGARFSVAGLVRLDYAPLWALAGLGAERLHDRLLGAPLHLVAEPACASDGSGAAHRCPLRAVQSVAGARRLGPVVQR